MSNTTEFAAADYGPMPAPVDDRVLEIGAVS